MDKLPLNAPVAFKEVEGDKENHYIVQFDDHPEGEGVMLVP